ncbi:MAG: tyrosine-type recombinase/integrase [Actinomycetota bacterium]
MPNDERRLRLRGATPLAVRSDGRDDRPWRGPTARLRHAFATRLLEANIHPKLVSEALGHASVGITLDVYSHVLPTMSRTAADAIDAVFEGGSAPKLPPMPLEDGVSRVSRGQSHPS